MARVKGTQGRVTGGVVRAGQESHMVQDLVGHYEDFGFYSE